MALTESTMIELGTAAPKFNLPDVVSTENKSFQDIKGEQGTLVFFICNHCPYVVHVIEELVRISNEYHNQGVGTVFISSNDVVKYPADSPEKMKDFAAQYGFQFPYLYDETQEIAKAYDAACTPDIYLFDKEDNLYYRGRLDQSRPGNNYGLNGADLRTALDALISGQPAPAKQYPSAGCNIKWK